MTWHTFCHQTCHVKDLWTVPGCLALVLSQQGHNSHCTKRCHSCLGTAVHRCMVCTYTYRQCYTHMYLDFIYLFIHVCMYTYIYIYTHVSCIYLFIYLCNITTLVEMTTMIRNDWNILPCLLEPDICIWFPCRVFCSSVKFCGFVCSCFFCCPECVSLAQCWMLKSSP